MGGIATAVIDNHSHNTLKVSEGKNEEFLITRHGNFEPPLNVINYYGKQESRQTVSEIDNGWEEVITEIVKIEAKDESFLLIGDLN